MARDTYSLKDDPKIPVPRPRQTSTPNRVASQSRGSWDLASRDPFPVLISVVVLTWIGLGLWSRVSPPAAVALIVAGFIAMAVGEVYLLLSIYRESPEDALLSLMSGWYRRFYLYQNMELTLRPTLISGCGLLMVVTGVFTFLKTLNPTG